jgi:aldehyde dehydrogenase (NAD+)
VHPLLCMLTYEDEADAIAIANDTPYGLQASAVANQIEAPKAILGSQL